MLLKTISLVDKRVEKWYQRLPSLSAPTKNSITELLPFLAYALAFFSFVTSGILKLLSYNLQDAYQVNGVFAFSYYLYLYVDMLAAFLYFFAATPLKKRKKIGWHMLFWVQIVYIGLAALTLRFFNVIAPAFGLYILYQIKPRYR